MIDLKKIFVLVPAGTIGEGKTTTIETIKTASSANSSKIYFVEDTNEIVVKGVAYGANPTDLARIAALEATVNGVEASEGVEAVEGLTSKVAALQTLLGTAEDAKGTDTAFARIKALETLVGPEAADADAVINKLNEVYAWFAEVAEDETGKALIGDVAANKAAIGTATVGKEGEEGYVEGTGLTKRIEDLEAKNAAEDFTVEDEAVEGKYVSSVSQGKDGKITVTREDLPELSVKEGSDEFVAVDNHEVEIKTVELADTVGMTKNEDGTWSAGTATSQTNGLATAADVAAEIVADEEVIAAALNDHEGRIKVLEGKDAVVTTVAQVAEGQYVTVTDEATEDSNDHDYKIGVTTSTVTRTQYATGTTTTAPALSATAGLLTNADVPSLTGYADDAAQKAINDWTMWETYTTA